MKTVEGHIRFGEHRTWYRVLGELRRQTPLLVLHGGPGAPHDYLEPIAALAESGRPLVFYDQLGCGNSDQPHDPELWTADLFLEELATVRRALQLDHLHILGHSWGGMLAMEYALLQPFGLESLIVADSPADMGQWMAEANRLRADLPPEVQSVLRQHEADGTTASAEYEAATMVFYRRHLCRTEPWPECLLRAFMKLAANPEVYHTMNGPSEFHCIGKLKDWSILDRLGEITVPTLVLSGKYDEATPLIAETVQRGVPGSEWVLFEESSHMPHIEETQRYLQVVGDFLARVEAGQRSRAASV